MGANAVYALFDLSTYLTDLAVGLYSWFSE